MFRTVALSIIRSFSLYTQQWHMSYKFADSLRVGSGRNCSSVLSIRSVTCVGVQVCFCDIGRKARSLKQARFKAITVFAAVLGPINRGATQSLLLFAV